MIPKFFRPRLIRSGQPEWDWEQFPLDDPRIPEGILERIRAMAGPGWAVCFTDTPQGGEWWLIDRDGELIEAFWLED
jgi:hypothetical protein